MEIDELKRNISQKRSNVEWLNNKILDTEIKLIMHHRKEKIEVSENELTRQVSKSEQIKKELKLRETCNKELKLKVNELTNEKEKYRKVTSQLIESQREVHEKEIQDLNLKLQNQINKSHVLKARDKSLMDEVAMLKATISKNNDQNQYLTNQVKNPQVHF